MRKLFFEIGPFINLFVKPFCINFKPASNDFLIKSLDLGEIFLKLFKLISKLIKLIESFFNFFFLNYLYR